MKPTAILAALAALTLATPTVAEVFRWTDKDGTVHYGDKAPGQYASRPVDVRVNASRGVSHEASARAPVKHVVMYSTSWCAYCKQARRYFEENRIVFTDYDIEKDASAKARYDRMGAQGVPVILVGDRRLNGFSVAGFRSIYD